MHFYQEKTLVWSQRYRATKSIILTMMNTPLCCRYCLVTKKWNFRLFVSLVSLTIFWRRTSCLHDYLNAIHTPRVTKWFWNIATLTLMAAELFGNDGMQNVHHKILVRGDLSYFRRSKSTRSEGLKTWTVFWVKMNIHIFFILYCIVCHCLSITW